VKSRPSKTARAGKINSRSLQASAKASLTAAAAGSSSLIVFLVGFMGAGKSTVGRALSQRLNWVFEDLDDRIEQRERRSVAEIFRDSGESEFRHAERAALQSLLEELHGGVARVVALGGGAFVQPENAAMLRAAGVHTVFLDAPVEELWRRCREQAAAEAAAERPLLNSAERFRDLYDERRMAYVNASLQIETAGRSVDEVTAEIMTALQLKSIEVRTEEGESE
jgi:shikimate kinase